ncbi:MAG: rhomboid family intramembrane serine protease [Halobacteriales archaeon]|nr:rhomboid family intramembrane serine protease [Halobacteriales archaeon]
MARITETRKVRRLKELASVSNVPIVVGIIAGLSGWLIVEYGGYTGNEVGGGLFALLDPTLYMISLFLHEGWPEYIGSMYFFIPAGVALTYMTNNKNVLAVVVVSHVFAVFLSGVSLGLAFAGTIAAAYGLLAAAMVRATKVGTEKYSEKTQQGAPIGIFVIAALGLLMMVTTSANGTQYMPVLVGFIFGGSAEALRVYFETRRVTSSDEDEDVFTTTGSTGTAGGEND